MMVRIDVWCRASNVRSLFLRDALRRRLSYSITWMITRTARSTSPSSPGSASRCVPGCATSPHALLFLSAALWSGETGIYWPLTSIKCFCFFDFIHNRIQVEILGVFMRLCIHFRHRNQFSICSIFVVVDIFDVESISDRDQFFFIRYRYQTSTVVIDFRYPRYRVRY